MLSQEDIDNQQQLLQAHRRTLAVLLNQQAQHTSPYVPPATVNGIRDEREHIRRIKGVLCDWGVMVNEHPDDEETVVKSSLSQQSTSSNPLLPQLRAPIKDFSGRTQEITQLIQAFSQGAMATICGVRGLGGIGKTELAYVVAHQLRDTFPGGQIFVELRGATTPVSREHSIRNILLLLGENPGEKDDIDVLQAKYSSKLAGKRILIIADDAKDKAQVLPLLPPIGCGLLVTSRNRFSVPGMSLFDLTTLSLEDAITMLQEICPRIGAQASELARLCGNLPLALRLSASFLQTNDSRSVSQYLQQFRQERLKYLKDQDDADNPQASVEASINLSYEKLTKEAQEVLCQLTILPGKVSMKDILAVIKTYPDITYIVEEIRRSSLIEWEASSKTFSMHDLVREFGDKRLIRRENIYLYAINYFFRLKIKQRRDNRGKFYFPYRDDVEIPYEIRKWFDESLEKYKVVTYLRSGRRDVRWSVVVVSAHFVNEWSVSECLDKSILRNVLQKYKLITRQDTYDDFRDHI